MKLDLLPLINGSETTIVIDELIGLPKELYEKTDIRKLSKIRLEGIINDIGNDVFNISVNVKGEMILPCSLSLEDVNYPFEININENVGNSDDFEENYKIVSNTLDILPILWENIVLEIPSKVIKPGVKMKTEGDGWSLANDGEVKNNQLGDLKELLDMEGK